MVHISFLKRTIKVVFLFSTPHRTGIFAYLNYHVPRTRKEILEILLKGLQRLEYRGYDSAGKKIEKVQGHTLLFIWPLSFAFKFQLSA